MNLMEAEGGVFSLMGEELREHIREFSIIMDELMLDLRFLRGLDNRKAREFREKLIIVVNDWKDKEYVPKILCALFIDFYPAGEACSYLYDKSAGQQILEFTDQMTELMRICVNSEK